MALKESLTETAFREIYSRILDGTYRSGEKLSVRTISDSLKLGRTPVVNAINQLYSIGLVEIRSQSGTYVCDMSVQKIREMQDIRRLLELAVIPDVLQHVDYLPNQEILDEMGRCADLFAENIAVDMDTAAEADTAFHYAYISLVSNEELLKLYDRNFNRIRLYQMQTVRKAMPLEYLEEAARDHKEILEAILRKDAQALRERIENHRGISRNMLSWRRQKDDETES